MELGIRSSIMRNTPTARSSTRIAPHGGELRHDLQGLTLQPLPVVTGRAGRIGLGPATLCESGLLAGSSTRSRFSPPLRIADRLAEPPQSRLQPRISTRFGKGQARSRMPFR